MNVYKTEREHVLLYIGEPDDVPIITLENYTKWYDIYAVMPDGSVTKVDVTIIQEAQEKFPDAQWIDHLFHPRLLYRVAQLLGGCVDERAAEVAAGRWMIEHVDDDKLKFYDPRITDE